MIQSLLARLRQGHHTTPFPYGEAPKLPERFRGRVLIAPGECPPDCRKCMDACPTEAISKDLAVDSGRCLFCGECQEACPNSLISHDKDYRLAVRKREHLCPRGQDPMELAEKLSADLLKLLGRSLRLRQVSAGGCNACELDTNVLNTIGWDLSRFGIQFVASPRHADGILVTGPVSQNMALALRKTWAATPSPKICIAVGACAISGGPFRTHPQTLAGIPGDIPVDLFVPGCPPHPLTILDGLLRLLGRVGA